jgi:RNA polymerase sigma-70 factor (ECF subfamily)
VDQLFRNHFDDVYRAVAHMLGPSASDADLEDLTQQVFVAAHRSLPRFRGESKPTTWLYGIAYRTVLVFLRSRRRRNRLLSALAHEPAPQKDPQRQVEQRQTLHQLWTLLMRIKPKKRLVFVLYEVEGLSGPEIAAALDIPENTVWTRLHHARRELVRLARSAGMEVSP